MREPPAGVAEADVLAAVRATWSSEVDAVAHLAVGFGAHHWVASAGGRPQLFVTLDALGARHSFASLSGAYAGAAALASSGLSFVVPTLSVVPFGDGALSATPWVEGEVAGRGPLASASDARQSVAQLAALHAADPPAGIPAWAPLVPVDFAKTLLTRLDRPWDTGPFGERARSALCSHADDVARWVSTYHRLADEARTLPWVPTHGEPHTRNMRRTGDGLVLVDWESLKLAPRERDLRTLVDSGHADLARAHPPMLEMFDLEWRLDEVAQYAAWFEAPHAGTASDEVAVNGLIEELKRPEWQHQV
ncbi:spectinomycin phosphotransferase [Nocardioides ginsengisegetis]|uniref:Spectinomycin phosphotransferase n=1 Tax=Nocardioides ginsengisegetis TaxID=661491 RepID=A0A7W3P8X3_9ACTN|nr:phosphotransferase [Nocardioides ginsengisegetis]MBA8802859.1 spectinomycin phosphotransferase [Nocardioides ginsengisegetis]